MGRLSKKQLKYLKRNYNRNNLDEISKHLHVPIDELNKIVGRIQPSKQIVEKKYCPLKLKTIYRLTPTDYMIFIGLFLAGLFTYVYTLTPGIAAGDCGELTCAVYFLGGAHSPGYPLYCIVGKLFMWLFYLTGRIVYRLTFLSAFGGAITISVTYLFFIKFLGRYHNNDKYDNLFFAKIPAIAASLYFLFSAELWAQAVIAEVYTVNSLFLPVMFLIALVYEERVSENTDLLNLPERDFKLFIWNRVIKIMYLFFFLFGIAVGDHHIIFGYFVPFAFFFIYPYLKDKTFLKSVIAITSAYAVLLIKVVFFAKRELAGHWYHTFAWFTLIAVIIYLVYKFFTEKPRLIIGFIIAFIFLATGLLIYVYMPIRSMANAPLDWGDTEHWQNFWNVVKRVQYRGFAQNVRELSVFLKQLRILFVWRLEQFTPYILILSIFGLIRLYQLNKKWFYFTVSFLLYYDIAFLQFNNFRFTPRDLYFARVFFIPSYMFTLFWIFIGLEYILKLFEKYVIKNSILKRRKIAWILAVVLLASSYLPFKENFKKNNVRHAWANDNYGRNILKTLEKDSILFTEGGDNQVFSLLYHTYVEHLRPDVDVFDQKGNVFLLYGNMMSMSGAQVFLSQVNNDYKKIKTGRPIYYTWRDKRRQNEINKLYNIEKYVLNNYEKIDSEKLLDDIIQLARKLKITVLNPASRNFKLINVSMDTPLNYFDSLLIKRKNETIYNTESLNKLRIFKRYNGNFEYRPTGILYRVCNRDEVFNKPIKYWHYYDFAWEDHPEEALNWDYLSREIIANYNFLRGDFYLIKARNKYNTYINNKRLKKTKESRYNYDLYKKYEILAYEKYELSQKYGFDMTAIQFNLSLLLEQRIPFLQQEKDTEGIMALLDKCITNYIASAKIENNQGSHAVRAYSAAGRAYTKKALFKPEKEVEYMNEALKFFNMALKINANYLEAKNGARRAQSIINYPTEKIKRLRNNLKKNPRNEKLLLELVRAHVNRLEANDAVKLLEQGLRSMPNNINIVYNLANLNQQLKKYDRAIQLYKKLLLINRRDPTTYFHLAENYSAIKKLEVAYNNYKYFLKITRDIPNKHKTVQVMINKARQQIKSLAPLYEK